MGEMGKQVVGTRKIITSAVAVCRDCNWSNVEPDGAIKLGRQHAVRNFHKVDIYVEKRWQYKVLGGDKGHG